jgi:hypothetical protein
MTRKLTWVGTFVAIVILLAIIARWCFGRGVFSGSQNLVLASTGIVIVSFFTIRGLHAWTSRGPAKRSILRLRTDKVAALVDRNPFVAQGGKKLSEAEERLLDEIEQNFCRQDSNLATMLKQMTWSPWIWQAVRDLYRKYWWQTISVAVFLVVWAVLAVYAASRHQQL